MFLFHMLFITTFRIDRYYFFDHVCIIYMHDREMSLCRGIGFSFLLYIFSGDFHALAFWMHDLDYKFEYGDIYVEADYITYQVLNWSRDRGYGKVDAWMPACLNYR